MAKEIDERIDGRSLMPGGIENKEERLIVLENDDHAIVAKSKLLMRS